MVTAGGLFAALRRSKEVRRRILQAFGALNMAVLVLLVAALTIDAS